ncbi:MAG: AAA family ATPase [Planctomycetota bacterium]
MTPTEIKKNLDALWKTRWPAFIWGPPGVGKSAIVAQLAAERGLQLVDIRAPLLDPTDLRGIPAVVGDRAEWFAPSFLPRADAPPGVLFFDELNAATPIVQASLYQLVLDRRIGDYRLPDGWHIVAAGNREEDRSVVFRMPSALANRFVHLEFTPTFDDWREWAVRRQLNPMIVAFLSLRRELLHKPGGTERAFPTPRSWEIAADIIDAFGQGVASDEALVGTVGKGAAIELMKFLQSELTSVDIDALLAAPETAPIPTKISSLYVLVSNIGRRGKEESVRLVVGKLLGRLPIEFATVLAKDLLREWPAFVRDAHFKTFVATNKEIFA